MVGRRDGRRVPQPWLDAGGGQVTITLLLMSRRVRNDEDAMIERADPLVAMLFRDTDEDAPFFGCEDAPAAGVGGHC